MNSKSPRNRKGSRLNARQLAFVRHLVAGDTHADAYLHAGYKSKDRDTAFGGASRLLRNGKVKAALRLAHEGAADKVGVTAEMIVGRLWLEARGLGPDTTSAARCRALELMGRKLGLWAADRAAGEDAAEALIRRLLAAPGPRDQDPPPARAGDSGGAEC